MKIKHLTMLAAAAIALLAGCGRQDASQAVLDNIFARRSVRSFTDQEVTPEQVETLLRAAMAAPSGMNLQPWRFVVVRDPAVKKALEGRRSQQKGLYQNAPVVIVVCGQSRIEGKVNANWEADCAAATENLLLAAQALGLGAVWTACHPYPDREGVAIKVLGLKDDIKPFCIIPVGYPGEETQPKDKWNPDNVRYERWSEVTDSTEVPVNPHRQSINRDFTRALGK